jgi:hypothetical protein
MRLIFGQIQVVEEGYQCLAKEFEVARFGAWMRL